MRNPTGPAYDYIDEAVPSRRYIGKPLKLPGQFQRVLILLSPGPNSRIHVLYEEKIRLPGNVKPNYVFHPRIPSKCIQKWVLWHSSVIVYDALSQDVPGSEKGSTIPALYWRKVTLKECFWYFFEIGLRWPDCCEYRRWRWLGRYSL